jgi:4-alpha-glucanotransferase
LHPERIREDGYRYVVEGWRHCLRRATAVRIDHIAGLHRLYWVPEGFDASEGVYVRYRGDELHAVLVLEADRAGTVVVGEDLGTVPTTVRRAMARDGILSSWVMQFASDAPTPLPRAPRRAMATLGTHDLPTFDAYWHGADIEDRLVRGTLDAAAARAERARRANWRRAVLEAAAGTPAPRSPDARAGSDLDTASELEGLRVLLRHLAAGPADLVLVDMEDLWLEPEPQNRPGTGGDAANFRRRWSYTLEQAEKDPHVVGLLGMVDHLRRGGAQ